MHRVILSMLLMGCVVAAPASASIILSPLDIDFRSAMWSGADGNGSWSYDGVTASAMPAGNMLWQDATDGLGIYGGENDEIDLREILDVNIDDGGKWLTGAWITDLFEANDGGVGEYGVLELNGGAYSFGFNGNVSHQGNGELFVDFGGSVLVESAVFWADNTVNGIDPGNNDFSVGGFMGGEPSPVPEPGTMALIGMGLLGSAAARRRRRKS